MNYEYYRNGGIRHHAGFVSPHSLDITTERYVKCEPNSFTCFTLVPKKQRIQAQLTVLRCFAKSSSKDPSDRKFLKQRIRELEYESSPLLKRALMKVLGKKPKKTEFKN